MEDDVLKLREDAEILCNPRFGSKETDDGDHAATKQAVTVVRTTLNTLNVIYKDLTTMCQQKRDLFIVCVKFHMTTRQVKFSPRMCTIIMVSVNSARD